MPVLKKRLHVKHSHGKHHSHHAKHGHEKHEEKHHHNSGAAGHSASEEQMGEVHEWNQTQPITQGTLITVTAGTPAPTNIQLTNPGKWLYGIQVVCTVATTDISNVALTFIINNFNILLNQSCQLLNPTKLLGFLYYPTPQPLIGTDTIQCSFNNQSGGTVGLYVSLFYIPRGKH